MRISLRLAAVVLVAAMAGTACTGGGDPFHLPPQPSATPSPTQAPTPPAPAATPTVREIAVGDVINDDIGGAGPPCTNISGWPVPCRYYALTAPADGTLTATVTWDPLASGNLLLLRTEGTDYPPVSAPWSPIVGQLKVVSGRRYSIEVGLAGADWDGTGPYVLTTVLK